MIENDPKNQDQERTGRTNKRRGAAFQNKVKRFKDTPLYKTSGNVSMETDGATYRFPNPFGAKKIEFYGVATNGTVRVNCFGIAFLGPSYYFTPQDSTSVGLAGEKQRFIQSGHWFLTAASGSPTYRARSIETTLVNIDWPTAADIVARLEITDYGPDYFEATVNLGSGWGIYGNFFCS